LDATAVGGTGHEQQKNRQLLEVVVLLEPFSHTSRPMSIKFRHDVDNVLKEAKKQNKPVLLDFSAAPM
jgi:hypothetical protein